MEILLEAWSRTRSNFGIYFSIANKTIFMFVKEKRNACSLWFIFVSILFAKKLCKFLLKLCAKCKSYVCIHIRIQIYNSISEIMFGYWFSIFFCFCGCTKAKNDFFAPSHSQNCISWESSVAASEHVRNAFRIQSMQNADGYRFSYRTKWRQQFCFAALFSTIFLCKSSVL